MRVKLVWFLTISVLLTATVSTASHAAPQSLSSVPNRAISDVRSNADSFGQNTSYQATATPAPNQPSGPNGGKIQVWWPDELYPKNNETAEEILLQQFDDFRLTYSSYDLSVRRKRTNGLGGILPTLRTARPIAPGGVPDLILMRRDDMITAAIEGLIEPLDDWVTPDLAGTNLLAGVRALGEIDGALYGVPYAITLTHTIYRASVFEGPLLTFDDVLTEEPVMLFPAGDEASNLTVLLQYLSAGGRLVDDTGVPTLDRDPLVAVLNYYEQGVDKGIFASSLLGYTAPDDYWNDFVSAESNLIGVNSAVYLSHKANLEQYIGLGPIPTLSGSPVSALDGWMWVVATVDPDRQERARVILTWLMGISQQGVFTETFGVLPSQARALRLWEDEAYAEFALDLLPDAQIISGSQFPSSAKTALQESFRAVLEGQPASSAADEALAKLRE